MVFLKKTLTKNVVCALSIFAYTLSFETVFAISYGGVGVRPAFPREDNERTQSIFVHVVTPGQVVEEGVVVVNNKTETKTLFLYATDSVPSSGGGFACAQRSEEKKSVGSWITLQTEEVTLEPNTNTIVPFTISVPESAGVGEHNGCILIQEKPAENVAEYDTRGMSLSFRTGLRVALTVPGEIKKELQIHDPRIQKKGDAFLLAGQIKNTGNVSVDTEVEMRVTGMFQKTIAVFGGMYPILKDQTSEFNFDFKKPFWGGRYGITFVGRYDPDPNHGVGGMPIDGTAKELNSQTIHFFSMPAPGAISVYVGIFLILIFMIFFFIKKIREWGWVRGSWRLHTVVRGETLESMAKKYGVSWKMIAKINDLKPPYAIEAGKKIAVPPLKKSKLSKT